MTLRQFKEPRWRNFEGNGEFPERDDSYGVFRPFYIAKVAPIDPGAVGELFLTESAGAAQLAQVGCDDLG